MIYDTSSGRSPDIPSIHLRLPPAHLLKFPPDPYPETLPAPAAERSWAQPFTIPPTLYNKLLSVHVPITIALVYATTVVLVNRLNQRRGYKPWSISQTRPFQAFVILHNVFLAVYSAWTCIGMVQAFRESWPTHSGKYHLVNVVDALCKINGPRGLGNAAIYDPNSESWSMTNPQFKLGPNNAPDPTDAGRLWNKGLAFFGWIFYLSKFYEVLDTAIILAKGKKSSTLQTYHHAGAMMCMWAGIRYMAAPIWIFALVNSGIHALMYTYYTLTAVSVPIPVRIKRTLTTMQITQFIIGTVMAASHLFVSYSLPVAVPRPVSFSPLSSTISGAGVAANKTNTVSSMGPWLKKLILRAAGAEGVAENVVNSQGKLFGTDGSRAAQAVLGKQETRYIMEPRTFTCMDTSGQAFAVWLNVLYLLPLTYLFGRFFVRSYLRRAERRASPTVQGHAVEKAGMDALKGVTREIRNAVIEMHGDENSEEASSANITGTNTPHPEAYEANVDNIMTAEQLRAEKKNEEIAKHPQSVRYQKSSKGSIGTPRNERAYEANVEDVMTRKQKDVNTKASKPESHPLGTKEFCGSGTGTNTPRDIKGYEANIEHIMDPSQQRINAAPQDSMAAKRTQ